MVKIQKISKLAKLSIAALLLGTSIVTAEDVPVVNVGGTKISLYGFLQLNAVMEDGNNNDQNWTEIVPSRAEDGEGRFMFNVNQTRIGFNLAGPSKEGGAEVSGKFEADFGNSQDRNNNGVGGFRIRQSYGQVKFNNIGLTLLMGQTSDLIAPLSAPTLNQGGLKSQGSLGTRRPMIRLSEAIGPVEVAVAATDDRGAGMPVMPGFQGSIKAKVPASWAGEKQNVELILSGHYATEERAANYDTTYYKDDPDKTTKISKYDPSLKMSKDSSHWVAPPTSWSGVVSLSLPVISMLSLSGEMFYGQNLKNYNNGSINKNGENITYKKVIVQDGGGTKEIEVIDERLGLQSMGGWGAVNIKLPAGFAIAGGIGVEAMDDDRSLSSTEKKDGKVKDNAGNVNDKWVADTKNPIKNMVIFGNLKYNFSETMFIGFEYANLTTEYADTKVNKDNKDGKPLKVDSGNMNRFELVLNYAFK
jgi:hypothetical protein